MIYALLTTHSAVHPLATSLPTPTGTPVIDAVSGWEKANVIGTISLGLVALVISVIALIITLSQQRKEEAMRKREAKIAVLDKAFEIYNFFIEEIAKDKYFELGKQLINHILRVNQVRYQAKMIFKEEIFLKIDKELDYVLSHILMSKLPNPRELADEYKALFTKDTYRKDMAFEESDFAAKNFLVHNTEVALVLMIIRKKVDVIFEEYRLNL